MTDKKPETVRVKNKHGAIANPLKADLKKWLDAGWVEDDGKAKA